MLYITFLEKINKDELLVLFASKTPFQSVQFNIPYTVVDMNAGQYNAAPYFQSLGYSFIQPVVFRINDLQKKKLFLRAENKGHETRIRFLPQTRTYIYLGARALMEDGIYLYPAPYLCFCSKSQFNKKGAKKPIFYFAHIAKNFPKADIFTETLNSKADSAYQIFKSLKKKALPKVKNVFFITQAKKRGPRELKKGGLKHLSLLYRTDNVITSWALTDMFLPNKWSRKYACTYPLLTHRWVCVPHKVSFVQRSAPPLSKYCSNAPDLTLCCSESEKEFLTKVGHHNVKITGYPRMDQLLEEYQQTTETSGENHALISFSSKKGTLTKETLLSSVYFLKAAAFVTNLKNQKTSFAFPTELPSSVRNLLRHKLSQIKPDITFIYAQDTAGFKKAFVQAGTLITDSSSLAFDFRYMGKKAILLSDQESQISPKNTDSLNFIKNSGASRLKEIDETQDGLFDDSDPFFKYHDKNNTRRALEEIWN